MKPLVHPALDSITVEGILHALSDPIRVEIFSKIAASGCAATCSSFLTVKEKAVPKSTLSQHFKVLRESGLIYSERAGVEMRNTSRCAEIETRFPGLLSAIVASLNVQARESTPKRRAKREAR
jgi:DNA-binding transcriptional ArsR family regulator